MDRFQPVLCLLVAFSVSLVGCKRESPAGQNTGSANVENELLAGDNEGPDEVIVPTDDAHQGDKEDSVSANRLIQLVKVRQVRDLTVGMNDSAALTDLSAAQLDGISDAQREFLTVEGETSLDSSLLEKLLTSPWVKDVTFTLNWSALEWAMNEVLKSDKVEAELGSPPDRKEEGIVALQPSEGATFTQDLSVTWMHWSWASAAFTNQGHEIRVLRIDARGWRASHPEPTKNRLAKETRDAKRAHPAGVSALVFLDNEQLASFGSRSVAWWNVSSGEKRTALSFTAKAKSSRCKYLAADGLLVLGAVQNGFTVDLKAKKALHRLPGFTWTFDLLPNARQAVVADYQRLSLWDLKQGALLKEVTVADGYLELKVRGDGKQIAAGATNGQVTLWELPEFGPGISLVRHTGQVRALAYSADGKVLYSGGWDGALNVWDSTTHAHLFERRTSGLSFYDSLSVSSDGKLLVASSRREGDKVAVWPLPDAQEANVIPSPGNLSGVVLLNPSNDLLVVAGKQGEIWLHQLPDGALTATLHQHTAEVTSLAISSDGKTLVSGDAHGHILVWSIPSGNLLRELGAPPDSP